MSIKVKPYPEYKESPSRWLGKVPSHWVVKPLKRWTTINRETLPEDSAPELSFNYMDISMVGEGQLVGSPKRYRFADAPSRARRVVRDGDTVMSTVRPYLRAVHHVQGGAQDLIASTGFAVLTPNPEVNERALFYAAFNAMFNHSVTSESVGASYPAIEASQLGRLPLALPPALGEQTRMAALLDHITKRLRKVIRGKRKLTRLLKEQEQNLINRAVTRGLDPKIALYDSRLEWLGLIPATWETIRLKNLFLEVDDRTTTGTEILLSLRMYQGLVPHVTVSDRPIETRQLIGYKRTRPGQIVMNRMRAGLGMFGVTTEPGIVSPDYAVFQPRRGLDLRYFLYLFKTPMLRGVFKRESRGLGTGSSGFLRLYSEAFGTIRVPVPPLADQVSIVDYLATTTRELQVAVQKTERQITVLKEYRDRLIHDVITGKVDVRLIDPSALPELPWEDSSNVAPESDDATEAEEELEDEAED